MTGLLLALALSAQDATRSLEAGLRAFREARYEDAERLLAEATASAPSYDGLVALALARGRLGRLAEAGPALDQAIALDPARPEAWVERGGLHFLEKRYPAAISDLTRALALREDAYTRDLLASSLHLAGRTEEALARWNVLGQPKLGQLDVQGLVHTKDRVVRRELRLKEDALLELSALRESRLRLAELGIFDRITLRPIPRGDGSADLQAALVERHGAFRGVADFVVSTGVNALGRRVRLRYVNIAGEGVSIGASYRWQDTRPEFAVSLDWPRPLGVPVVARVVGVRGRQRYDLADGPLDRRSHGLDVTVRRVLGSSTVGQLGFRRRERSVSRLHVEAPAGTIQGLEAGLERRLLDRHRHRVDASARYFRALVGLGSDLTYSRAFASLGYRAQLSAPDGSSIEPSVLALQVRVGHAGSEMPLDEAFAPGGSLDMELPLRAHRQTRRGILGVTPLGRSLALTNVEWRRRLYNGTFFQLGSVVFYDGARISGLVGGGRRAIFHDVGVGLRFAIRGSPVVRIDVGHGLTDGRNALFAGLGQAF